MSAKVVVRLSDEQRDRLDDLTRIGARHVRAVQHARTLLLADEADRGPAWDDERIAEALACSPATVALACSTPPEGRAVWTTRLLADRYVALGVAEGWLAESVSRETVRLALKKTRSGRTASKAG